MLRDLYVMKIDAKQELDNMNDANDITRFKEMILVPDGISIDSLLDGDRYFLTGEKGAGKTALLIYTALMAEELFNAERSFIVFKEFSQEEREDYTALAHVTHYDQEEITPCMDYEYVWWWVFHNTIAEAVETSEKEIFIKNEALDTYLEAIKVIKTNPRGSGRKMPVLTKDGYVELQLSIPARKPTFSISGKINFERNPDDDNKIRFSTHINELNRLYSNLNEGESQLYVVVDEMNLSRKNAEEYERDVIMIRDLIVAIERFNAISKQAHNNVRIIGSIRNEVINSVKSKGKEINKSIESYGIPIDWTQYSEESLRHPLIKLLINYFRISDKLLGNTPANDEEEYYRWVSQKMFGTPSEEIIRNYTLYRPRHVVRLLNIAKLRRGSDAKITDKTFNSIKREYSIECWNEIAEDLALSYTQKELEIIKEWLTGMPWRTTYTVMREAAETQWKTDDIGKSLLLRFDDLMRDLYRSGIIGSYQNLGSSSRHRWYFRGDHVLLKDLDIQIHRIFQPVLSTVPPK